MTLQTRELPLNVASEAHVNGWRACVFTQLYTRVCDGSCTRVCFLPNARVGRCNTTRVHPNTPEGQMSESFVEYKSRRSTCDDARTTLTSCVDTCDLQINHSRGDIYCTCNNYHSNRLDVWQDVHIQHQGLSWHCLPVHQVHYTCTLDPTWMLGLYK